MNDNNNYITLEAIERCRHSLMDIKLDVKT